MARWREVVSALAATTLLAACSGASEGAGSTSTTRPEGEAATTAAVTSSTVAPDPSSGDLVTAACAGTLAPTVSAPTTEPLVKEASGVAPTAGRTWVHNDSGDQPRLYGLGGDGSVQVVAVQGAEAVDWEDLAWSDAGGPHLWAADTGDNARKRRTVQLYRVAVPAEGAASATAERVDVTYPDGAHDVEAVFVDPDDGAVYLLTKFEQPSTVFRVEPPAGGGAVVAEPVGSFPPGRDGTGIVTGAAIAPDRRAIAVRTYDAAWLYPVAPGQPVGEALADTAGRCQAPAGTEAQGEAIGFLADGSGYVTVGEGARPATTTFTPK